MAPRIAQHQIDFAGDLLRHLARHTHAAGRRDAFEARGDIDAVTVDFPTVLEHLAEVDSDTKEHTPVLGQVGVAPRELRLHRSRRSDAGDDAGELRQHRITGIAQHRAAMTFNGVTREVQRVHDGAMSAHLVRARQPAVADHVRVENGRELPGCVRV